MSTGNPSNQPRDDTHSNELFRAIVDQTPVSVVITDLEGTIQYVNPQFVALTGYSEAEAVGRNPRILQSGEHGPLFYQEMWTTVLGGDIWRGMIHNVGKDGRHFWELAHIAPVRDISGEIVQIVAIKQDMTQQRKTDERIRLQGVRLAESLRRAEEASRAKTAFLANVSHEIRTPLTGIVGLVDMLLDEVSDARQLGRLRMLKEASESLNSIVNDVLDLSKIEEGHSEVVEEEVTVAAFLKKLVARHAVAAEQKGLKLASTIDDRVPERIRTDGQKLGQILTNLISNAVKFTKHGHIRVSVAPLAGDQPHMICFSVEDTGIGIDPEKAERLFEPFTQLDSSYSKSFAGTGLGLAISKRLAELLGGSIRVDGMPGAGSTFSFSIRYSPSDSARQGRPRAPRENKSPTNDLGLSVLLAEDNRINQLVVRHMLEKAGIEVKSVDNGTVALKAMREELFDVVLLDIQMPGMNGIDVVESIREFERSTGRSRQPVIALTAYALSSDKNRILKAGVDGFVSKPVKSTELLAKILSAHSASPIRRVS